MMENEERREKREKLRSIANNYRVFLLSLSPSLFHASISIQVWIRTPREWNSYTFMAVDEAECAIIDRYDDKCQSRRTIASSF